MAALFVEHSIVEVEDGESSQRTAKDRGIADGVDFDEQLRHTAAEPSQNNIIRVRPEEFVSKCMPNLRSFSFLA